MSNLQGEGGSYKPAPELLQLGPAGQLWIDATSGERVFASLAGALVGDPVNLDMHVNMIDDAVTAGLAALGFPRGYVNGVAVTEERAAWSGHKRRDCFLLISAHAIRVLHHRAGGADSLFRTWVHESIHARQEISKRTATSYAPVPGYEEGLAEGLARYLISRGGVSLTSGTVEYYVAAYHALAQRFGLDIIDVWRALWAVRPGEVDVQFSDVVARLASERASSHGSGLSVEQLKGIGDRVFSKSRIDDTPNQTVLMRLWQTI